MENLNGADSDYLLQNSIEDLYQSSHYWLSDIEFWKTELLFFQDLLDKHAPRIESADDKKQLDHFQNLIIYYNGELLDEYYRKVRKHTKYLAKMIENGPSFDDYTYREMHKTYEDQIISINNRLKEYKIELFNFIKTIW